MRNTCIFFMRADDIRPYGMQGESAQKSARAVTAINHRYIIS